MDHDLAKHTIDAVSAGVVFATLAGWMPVIAAFLSAVWALIRIYETKTVQKMLGRI